MKKHLLIFAAMAFVCTAFAQIPNAGFQTWNNMGTYSNPANWSTMNNTTASSGTFTATMGTNGVSGSFLHLTSKTIGPSVVNGIAVCGQLDSITMKPKSGFPFTQQPQSLTGYYEHMGQTTGSIQVALTKWNTSANKRDTIAYTNHPVTGMQMAFASFSISLNYLSSVPPDSCIIFLSASGTNPIANDYLNLDSLTFSGNASGIETLDGCINGINIYPNPTNENISIDFDMNKSEDVKIQMVDLNGKMVKQVNHSSMSGANKYVMNINGIAKGTYFINVVANEAIETKKIVIE